MAIAFRANGAFTAADATSTGSIGLPAGLADGDVLVLPIQARGGGTITTPSGYTRAAQVNITKGHRLAVYYKYVTNAAGEAAPNVTHSASGLICGRLTAFSGADPAVLDVNARTDQHTDLATVTAKSINPVTAGAMAVWVFSTADNNTLNAATQGTTAYSDDTTTGVDGSLALVYELQTNVAATGTCSMTQSANGPDNWNTITLALRPLAVVAADPTRTIGYDGITYAVEMAFGASPFAPTPTWTDISAYVRADQGINVTRGRNSEFSDVQPGTMNFTLDNRDRRFDPEYSAGPYFGQLLPMTRVRFRARHASVNYPIFDGYVQTFDQAYQYPRESTVSLTAVDLFARLATRKLPATILNLTVLNDGPAAYFPFDESEEPNAIDLSGNSHDGITGHTAPIESFIPAEPDRHTRLVVHTDFATTDLFNASGTTINLIRTMEAWLQVDALGLADTSQGEFVMKGRMANGYIQIKITSNAEALLLQVLIVDSSLAQGSTYTGELPSVGSPIHVAGVLDSTASTFTVYVNGDLVHTGSTTAATFESGALDGVLTIQATNEIAVEWGHVALYEEELTQAQVLEHIDIGNRGGNLQTVPERMDLYAEFAGLTAAGLYDDTELAPNTYLAPATVPSDALSAMQSLMRSEQGRLFVDADGILIAQGRTADMHDVTTNAVSQATLADSGVNAYVDLHIQPGTIDLLRNAIYLTVAGVTVSVIDEASRVQFDEREESFATELATVDAARNLGLSRIRRFSDPATRIDGVTLLPHGAADVRYPIVLALNLGWRFTVSRTPQAIGSAISKLVTVEGITHTINEALWLTSLYLVPGETPYTVQPWFVFGDATYGRFGAAAGNQLSY